MDVSVTSYSPYNLQTTTSKQIRGSTSASSENSSLSAEESRQLQQLKARDREVRAHEAAHVAAGGNLVRGGASFTYQQGPDGQQYAIGGEVSIDTSKVANDPEATLQKANQIRAAALAPSSPSSQDRSVAAKASQLAIEARAEIAQQRN
jgi:hypothetical protein